MGLTELGVSIGDRGRRATVTGRSSRSESGCCSTSSGRRARDDEKLRRDDAVVSFGCASFLARNRSNQTRSASAAALLPRRPGPADAAAPARRRSSAAQRPGRREGRPPAGRPQRPPASAAATLALASSAACRATSAAATARARASSATRWVAEPSERRTGPRGTGRARCRASIPAARSSTVTGATVGEEDAELPERPGSSDARSVLGGGREAWSAALRGIGWQWRRPRLSASSAASLAPL